MEELIMKKSKKGSPKFLTKLESDYLYIKRQYETLALQVDERTSGTMHHDEEGPVYEFGGLYSLLSIKQRRSQEMMKLCCERIEYNRRKNNSKVDSFIYFDRNLHLWTEATSYGCGMCILEYYTGVDVIGGKHDCFDIDVGTRLYMRIYIGENEAYMRAESDLGDVYYFELNKFSMLYNEVDEPECAIHFTKSGNGDLWEVGRRVIVVFDRSRELSYISTFPMNDTPQIASLSGDDDSDKPEATADVKEEAADVKEEIPATE
jgi:hypothetical protein